MTSLFDTSASITFQLISNDVVVDTFEVSCIVKGYRQNGLAMIETNFINVNRRHNCDIVINSITINGNTYYPRNEYGIYTIIDDDYIDIGVLRWNDYVYEIMGINSDTFNIKINAIFENVGRIVDDHRKEKKDKKNK